MHTRARLRIVGAALVALVASVATAAAQQAVIVVRHAERADQSTDSPLSADGRTRAKALAELLRSAGVTHVITTQYVRTRETAAPLAEALGLTPEAVTARDVPALIAKLKTLPPTAIVLVVGHSNTVPAVLTGLGVSATIELGDGDFDNVFVVAPHAGQPASMVRLKYGRATP